MANLTVSLGERSYPIHIDAGLLSDPSLLTPYLKSNKAVIVTNDTIAPLYAQKLTAMMPSVKLEIIEIPDGEQYKNLEQFNQVITRLLEMHAARDTTLIALGGGVVGDLTGFVAASFQRGMPFVQVPTTLLSQVDSSVGGKTAVNHPLGKNMIGAFYQPKAVLIDTDTLRTLPPREFSAGMAEVIKYGIIHDSDFFAWLEDNQAKLRAQDTETLIYAIQRCCEIKALIVAQDERESGVRALLNLGHTFGHAIEAEQGYGNWLHGEAVSAGMVLAAQLAHSKGWLGSSELQRIEALLAAFDLPTRSPTGMGYGEYMRHMSHDKKVEAGKIRFIIPTTIGQAIVSSDVSEQELRNLLD